MRPKRFFAFGCSFTNYYWATWANVLALDLYEKYGTKFYNYGKLGAGNQYISLAVSQADICETFNENDLVIVCWSNIARLDSWLPHEKAWSLKGNVFTSGIKKNYKDLNIEQMLIENLNIIYYTTEYLKQKKCQSKFYSMVPIFAHDQYGEINVDIYHNYNDISQLYGNWINRNIPYSYSTHFNKTSYHEFDRHPYPSEHCEFIGKDFDIADATTRKAEQADKLIDNVFSQYSVHKTLPDCQPQWRNLGLQIKLIESELPKYLLLKTWP